MNKELNCMNCCIGDFKESLCDCNNGICKEYKKVGRAEDFEKEVIKRTKPKAGEWIPCSERLPSEKDGHVLVTKRGEVRVATYSEFSGTWYVGEMCAVGGEDPIAWMPLPMPYREESEVEE